MSNRDSWAASSDPDRVTKLSKELQKRLAAGDHPKRANLIRTPGSDKDIVIDGHHHLLAAEAERHAVGVRRARRRKDRPVGRTPLLAPGDRARRRVQGVARVGELPASD
jgi:hypothetical protein